MVASWLPRPVIASGVRLTAVTCDDPGLLPVCEALPSGICCLPRSRRATFVILLRSLRAASSTSRAVASAALYCAAGSTLV